MLCVCSVRVRECPQYTESTDCYETKRLEHGEKYTTASTTRLDPTAHLPTFLAKRHGDYRRKCGILEILHRGSGCLPLRPHIDKQMALTVLVSASNRANGHSSGSASGCRAFAGRHCAADTIIIMKFLCHRRQRLGCPSGDQTCTNNTDCLHTDEKAQTTPRCTRSSPFALEAHGSSGSQGAVGFQLRRNIATRQPLLPMPQSCAAERATNPHQTLLSPSHTNTERQ